MSVDQKTDGAEQVLFGDTFAAEFTIVAAMFESLAQDRRANTPLFMSAARRFNLAMPDLPERITSPDELEEELVVDTLNWMMLSLRAGMKEAEAESALRELESRYLKRRVQVSVLRDEAPAFIEIEKDPSGELVRSEVKTGGQIDGKILAICPDINAFTVLSVTGGRLNGQVALYDVEFIDPLTGMEAVDVRFLD